MTIKTAECDSCNEEINTEEGDELFSFKSGVILCRKCHNQRFDDLVVEDDEE